MNTTNLNIDKLCQEAGAKTPEELLIHISNGTDPRRFSQIYTKIQELVEEYGDEPPDVWDWLELLDLIKSELRFGIVTVSESASAAKTLLEYKYPKRKAVEKILATAKIEEKPLSVAEIKNLRKEFDLDF